MIINGILAIIGFVLLYICWSVSVSSLSRLAELGIEHDKSSSTYFDSILWSGVLGLVLSRLTWMVMHLSVYQDVPWGILPYSRTAVDFVWFTLFPWRFLRLTEGLSYPVLWVVMGVFIIFSIFVPTIQLARKLRLEKRGIMRSFIVKNLLCIGLALLYFSLLTYFVWGN